MSGHEEREGCRGNIINTAINGSECWEPIDVEDQVEWDDMEEWDQDDFEQEQKNTLSACTLKEEDTAMDLGEEFFAPFEEEGDSMGSPPTTIGGVSSTDYGPGQLKHKFGGVSVEVTGNFISSNLDSFMKDGMLLADVHELKLPRDNKNLLPLMRQGKHTLVRDEASGSFWLFRGSVREANMTPPIATLMAEGGIDTLSGDYIISYKRLYSGFQFAFYKWDGRWCIRKIGSWCLLPNYTEYNGKWTKRGKEVLGVFHKIESSVCTAALVYYDNFDTAQKHSSRYIKLGDADVIALKLYPFISEYHYGIIVLTETSWGGDMHCIWFNKRNRKSMRTTRRVPILFHEDIRWCREENTLFILLGEDTAMNAIDLKKGELQSLELRNPFPGTAGVKLFLKCADVWLVFKSTKDGTMMQTITRSGGCYPFIIHELFPLAKTRCDRIVFRGDDGRLVVFSPRMTDPENFLLGIAQSEKK